jgi:hypothetical protein
MADRIFPNRFQEDPLDSDLVFQGIDWDNFNQRLAEAKEPKENKGLKALIDAIGDEEVDRMQAEAGSMDDDMEHEAGSRWAKKGLPEGLKKWMEENGKGKKAESDDDDDKSEKCPECDCDPCECDEKGPMKRKGPKNKSEKKAFHFNHPSQLSAEAVEAAIASGDEDLKNAILAARHERRVRLAGKIERQVKAQEEANVKLAQRKAYREALVEKVVEAAKEEKDASMDKECSKCAGKGCEACNASDDTEMKEAKAFSNAARKAFAAKALAEGFPIEYINARLGETTPAPADNLVEIKSVLASELESNVKIAAASSMIKTATLSDADYSRLIDYWKNELGYGDQEWIDKLFTKEYDK